MINKLKRRFVIILTCIFGVIVLGIAVAVFTLMYTSEARQSIMIMEQATSRGGFSGVDKPFDKPSVKPDGEDKTFVDNSKSPADENNSLRNCVYVKLNADNSIAYTNFQIGDTLDEDELAVMVAQACATGDDKGVVTCDGVEYRFLISQTPFSRSVVFLDRSIELTTLRRLLVILIAITIVAIMLFFVISVFLARWAVKPIAVSWEKQKRFVADASHELKTPLTVIEANTDVVLSNPESTVAEQSKWLGNIKAETVRMSKLVYDLLFIAKIDSSSAVRLTASEISEVNLSEAVTDVCMAFEALAFEHGKELNYDGVCDGVIINGDCAKLKQLATILVDNAVIHSAESARIEVSLRQEGKTAELSVASTGEAISEEIREKIFERFFRADESRARITGGCGLGLAIAKSICEQHSGEISVSYDKGMNIFTCKLGS